MITVMDGPDPVSESHDGRGLLTPRELAEAGPPEAVRVPLDMVDASPKNPREKLVEIEALAESIKDVSLLHPIAVRRSGERYEVLGGHRRLAAYALLREREPFDDRWRSIPAQIRTMDDDRAYVALVASQVHNLGWRPKEEAAALERLAESGRSVTEIGSLLHKSKAWASIRLRVYADVALSALVQTGRIDTGVAQELLAIKDFETRKAYAFRAAAEHWSQDQARSQVRALRLDRQVTDLGRRIIELLDILSRVRRSDIPLETFRDSQVLRGRLESLADEARGPTFPAIEAAEREAGVSPAAKARAERERQRQQRVRQAARRKKP